MTLQVVVPSYNCSEWIERCLRTIYEQTYTDYEVIVIDDASTDGAPAIIERICDVLGWSYRFNGSNMGAGFNIYHAIKKYLAPSFDDPIVIIDGDDFLPHENVFKRVAEIYEDLDVWLMWTNYVPYPHDTGQTQSADYPPDVVEHRSYRQAMNYFNHMLTFRFFVFDMTLLPRDLCIEPGRWAKAGYDRMIYVPMLEAVGTHYGFLDEVLYSYNAVNPISDVFVRLPEAQEAHRRVAGLEPKPLLDPAWVEDQRLHA